MQRVDTYHSLYCDVDIDSDQIKELAEIFNLVPTAQIIQTTRGLVNVTLKYGAYFITIFGKKHQPELEAIAQILHGIDSIPIVKPLRGKNGYVYRFGDKSSLVSKKLPGVHYVGESHEDKKALPIKAHKSVAKAFWDLHSHLPEKLSVSNNFTAITSLASVKNYTFSNKDTNELWTRLMAKASECDHHELDKPQVVHADMERQNVLFCNSRVSGIVDLDAIREGDLLFEFSHFLFNFICCDPLATKEKMDLYIDAAIEAGSIDEKDLVKIHSYICKFCIADILSFIEVTQQRKTNIAALIKQYSNAINFSNRYFRNAYLS